MSSTRSPPVPPSLSLLDDVLELLTAAFRKWIRRRRNNPLICARVLVELEVSSASPTIVSVEPAEGSSLGEQEVIIELDNFKPVLLVIFGDQEAQILEIDEANKSFFLAHLREISGILFSLFRRLKVVSPRYQPKAVPVFLIDPSGTLHSSATPCSFGYLQGILFSSSRRFYSPVL